MIFNNNFKTLMKNLFLFCLTIIVLASCSEDDGTENQNEGKGKITLDDNTSLTLDYAVLDGKISTGSHYNYLLYFFDKEIEYSNLTNELQKVEHYLYLTVFSECPEAISFGDFDYYSTSDLMSGIPNEGYIGISAVTRFVDGIPKLTEVDEGSISIAREENENEDLLQLTVTFDLKLTDGTELTGEYSGLVDVFGSGEIDETCVDDSKNGGENDNSIMYGDESLDLNDGFIFDYGVDPELPDHYGYGFLLSSEDNIDPDLTDYTEGEDYIWIELNSLGTSEFKAGTYNLIGDQTTLDQNFMSYVEVALDYDAANPTILTAELGAVVVERTNNEYTLTFDLTLNNGRKITGSYTGEFDIKDETEDGPVNPDNYFIWDGTQHEIAYLEVADLGPIENHYGYEFYFFTKSANAILGGDSDYKVLYFTALSWGNSSFADGDFSYFYGAYPDSSIVQDIDYLYYAETFDNVSEHFNIATSGSTDIERNGDKITINLNFILDDGESISGYYSGDYAVFPAGGRIAKIGRRKKLALN